MNEISQETENIRTRIISFPLGQIVATPGALDLLDRGSVNAADLINRHQCGDWGIVPPEDVEDNEFAILNNRRILSSYLIGAEYIWVLTEADRSSTTLLLPLEY